MQLKSVIPSGNSIVLRLEERVASVTLALRGAEHTRYKVPFSLVEGGIEISFTGLLSALPNAVARYDVFLSPADSDGEDEQAVLVGARGVSYWKRFWRDPQPSSAKVAHLYANLKGALSVVVRSPTTIDHVERNFRCEHTIKKLSIGRGKICLEFVIEPREEGDFFVERCYLRLDSESVLFDVQAHIKVRQRGEKHYVVATLDIPKNAELQPLNYSIYTDLLDRRSTTRVSVRTGHLSHTLYTRLHKNFHAKTLPLQKNRVLALATSRATTVLGFVVRDSSTYDTRRFQQISYAAISKFASVARRMIGSHGKPTALIFEKEAQTAQDNAFALLQHLDSLQGRVPFQYFFVMDPQSPQWTRVSDNPAVIQKYSLAFWKLLSSPATFLVASEVRFHLANLYAQPDRLHGLLSARRHYFLQHGVLGLKKVVMYNTRSAMFPDFTVASSEWEQQILCDSGVHPKAIDITGLPRWDRLPLDNQSETPISRILYMPTWRSWLEGQDSQELSESQFVSEIIGFLRSPALEQLLRENRCELQFVPHPKMRKLLEDPVFSSVSGRVVIVDQDVVEFHTLVRNSDVFITDYSSFIGDFVQSRKPAVLFQFDQDRYQETTGSYVNQTLMDVLHSVPTVSTPTALLCVLQHIINEPASHRREQAEQLRAKAFPYADNHNSQRVVEAITARLADLIVPVVSPCYEEADRIYEARLAKQQKVIDRWVDPPSA